MKVCSICKNKLDYSQFYKRNNTKDGLRYECKSCSRKKSLTRHNRIKTENQDYLQKIREKSKEWYIKNRAKVKQKSKNYHINQRKKCIEYYGSKCACCGEDRYEFLAIDHINGGGRKQKQEGVTKITRWLVANNFPEGFRILCHNCNTSLGAYGYCPHTTKPESDSSESHQSPQHPQAD